MGRHEQIHCMSPWPPLPRQPGCAKLAISPRDRHTIRRPSNLWLLAREYRLFREPPRNMGEGTKRSLAMFLPTPRRQREKRQLVNHCPPQSEFSRLAGRLSPALHNSKPARQSFSSCTSPLPTNVSASESPFAQSHSFSTGLFNKIKIKRVIKIHQ